MQNGGCVGVSATFRPSNLSMLQGSPFIPFVWILLRTLLHNGTLQVFLFQSIAHSFRRHGGVYPLEGGVKLRVGRCTLAHWHKPLFSSGRAAMT